MLWYNSNFEYCSWKHSEWVETLETAKKAGFDIILDIDVLKLLGVRNGE